MAPLVSSGRISLDQVPSTASQLVIRHFSGPCDGEADLLAGVVHPDGTVDAGIFPERLPGGSFAFDYQFRAGRGVYLFGLYLDDGETPWDDLVFPVFVDVPESPGTVTGHLLQGRGKLWSEGLDPAGATPVEVAMLVFQRLNEIRSGHGAPAVSSSPSLSFAADMNARDMAESGLLTHKSVLRGRVHERLAEVEPDHSMVVELISSGLSAGAAVEKILASPRYRAGLLDPAMTHMGVGVCKGADKSVFLCVNLIRSHEAVSPTAASGMVLKLLNEVRAASEAKPLTEEFTLSDIAYRHATAMAASGKVTSRPDGIDLSSEIRAMSTVFSKIRLKTYSTPEPGVSEKGDIDDPGLTHAGVGVVRGKAQGGGKVYFVSIIMGVARGPIGAELPGEGKRSPKKGRGATKKPGSK